MRAGRDDPATQDDARGGPVEREAPSVGLDEGGYGDGPGGA